MLGAVETQLWLRKPAQAARWCAEMMKPGRAVVLGLTRAVHDVTHVALLDTTGQILLDEPCTRRCLLSLVEQTSRRIVIAYNQAGTAAAIERAALHHRVELQHLEETALVPAIGSTRRIRALATLGWSVAKLAAELGVNRQRLGRLALSDTTSVETARAIGTLYDRLWCIPAPASTSADKAAATRARAESSRLGWNKPLDWEDDTLDDPNAQPFNEAQVTRLGSRS